VTEARREPRHTDSLAVAQLPGTTQHLTGARLAVSTVFCLHGLASGLWVARIPAVQETLNLGVGALGLALLGSGIGSLAAMLPMGALIARRGSRRVTLGAGLGTAVSLVLLALAYDGLSLFGALVAWGATLGTLDVAMNAQGSAIEQRRGRPIMSSLHGVWSTGSMSGAALGALLAAADVPPRMSFLSAAVILVVAVTYAVRRFVPDRDASAKRAFVWPRGALLLLSVVVFCAVMVEGAMFEWSGVYLRRVLDAAEATAAAGPSFFAAAMAIGRLVGDQITGRFGAGAVARACAMLGAVGVAGIVLAPRTEVVYGCLVLVGFGLSVLVPLAFSAAGREREMPAGAAIAAVATVGYSAFLFGPPTIGLVAEVVTLRGAFALMLGLLLVIALLSRRIEAPLGSER
jgi:fucose permease